jgi:hypothetical protein
MTIILAIWKAEICRIVIGGQPRKKLLEIPDQLIVWCSGIYLSSQATLKAEIRIAFPGLCKQKNLEDSISMEKIGCCDICLLSQQQEA